MSFADDIMGAVFGAAEDAALLAAEAIKVAAIHNMPVGDPEEDPDPNVALAENVNITPSILGGYVISVDTPYAAKAELDMRLKHPRGGGSRYLQRALAEVTPRFVGMTASKVDAETKTGHLSDRSRSHHRRRA
jgi:hypothetical protein